MATRQQTRARARKLGSSCGPVKVYGRRFSSRLQGDCCSYMYSARYPLPGLAYWAGPRCRLAARCYKRGSAARCFSRAFLGVEIEEREAVSPETEAAVAVWRQNCDAHLSHLPSCFLSKKGLPSSTNSVPVHRYLLEISPTFPGRDPLWNSGTKKATSEHDFAVSIFEYRDFISINKIFTIFVTG